MSEETEVESMLKHLDGWKGSFSEESVGATVYSYW